MGVFKSSLGPQRVGHSCQNMTAVEALIPEAVYTMLPINITTAVTSPLQTLQSCVGSEGQRHRGWI